MPNDQAAMIAEAEKILNPHKMGLRYIGNGGSHGVEVVRIRRDFGAEAVEKLVSHNEMVHLLRVDMIEIANSAANAALDEVIEILNGLRIGPNYNTISINAIDAIAALKSTPSPEAQ